MNDSIPLAASGQEDKPLIPAGTYALKFTHWETRNIFNTGKVFVWFEVLDYGEAFGVKLARHYNAGRLNGKPGRKGRFTAGKCSDLARELFTVLEQAGESVVKPRFDKLPMHLLANHTIMGKVVDVKRDSKRKKIPQACWYSVISELTGIRPT